MAKGDEVVTFGGIVGTVLDVDAESGTAQVEIANGVVVKMLNAALMQSYDPEQIAADAKRGLREDVDVE